MRPSLFIYINEIIFGGQICEDDLIINSTHCPPVQSFVVDGYLHLVGQFSL